MSDWRELWLPAHHSDECRSAWHGGGGGHHRDHQVRDTGGINEQHTQRAVIINITRLMMTAVTFKLRTRVWSTRMDWT